MEQLGGTSAGRQYDQTVIQAGGTVALDNSTLNISFLGGFLPTVGQQFTIIKNQSGSSVIGTFIQGSTYTVDGYTFGINYAGGAGDDVVLTVLAQASTTSSASSIAGAPPTSSLFGQSAIVTATVIAHTATVTAGTPASGTPMGTVVFENSPSIPGTVSLGQGGTRWVHAKGKDAFSRERWGRLIVVNGYRSHVVVTKLQGTSLPGKKATR
jgi:hypothetical protein